ncbi:MAG: aminoglycoside phosphotransferase family protein [Nocardioidaceae bacterium]
MTNPDRLAEDLADALRRLHSLDPAGIPPQPEGWESESRQDLLKELSAVADLIRPLLDDELRATAQPYLTAALPRPPYDGPNRVIHNDMCADHVLVDPESGRLTGLLDFTDVIVGDPVLDFVGLVGVGDLRFVSAVIDRYGLSLDKGYADRLRWLTCVLTLLWLGEAATDPDGPADVDKHVLWVRRAFG